jgi:hypothetical protein
VTTKHSRRNDNVVGLVLHRYGTLRLIRTQLGNLRAEVVGFQSGQGRDFLEQLHELGDIADDIMCCDDPVAMRAPWNITPTRHERRRS